MILNGFKFEYEVCPDREGNSTIQLLLEINNDKYILLCNNRNNICKIDITSKVDAFCKGLLKMNINEWNQKKYDEPWEFFPSFYWNLSISANGINVECKGIDNLPDNWNEFRALLCEIGIADSKFPFQ